MPTALDVILAILADAPGEQLQKLRKELDRRVMAAQVASRKGPDRETWGLQPHQVQATKRLMGQQ